MQVPITDNTTYGLKFKLLRETKNQENGLSREYILKGEHAKVRFISVSIFAYLE